MFIGQGTLRCLNHVKPNDMFQSDLSHTKNTKDKWLKYKNITTGQMVAEKHPVLRDVYVSVKTITKK